MQPYFFPYAGYFSLVQSVDHFVIFDCVQFPRRGWVHRNRVPGPDGREEWLTLPMLRQPRETLIRDLLFAENAGTRLTEQLKRYDWLFSADNEAGEFLRHTLLRPLSRPVEFLASSLQGLADLLGLQREFTFSSDLGIDPSLRGQDRVIAAVKAVGGVRYVNPSGGRELYSCESFDRHGLQLFFLNSYVGSHWSLLYRLAVEDPDLIAREIRSNAEPVLA
jgi:hypothetical protein